MAFEQQLDKVGVVGSLFAALCCLGFPALLSVLAALGLGFLIKDAVLLPLLVAFLGLTLYGFYRGYRQHGKAAAVVLGAGSAVALLLFLFVSRPLAYLAIAGLIVASVLNVRLRMHHA
jgi:mercuric ion transport protein